MLYELKTTINHQGIANYFWNSHFEGNFTRQYNFTAFSSTTKGILCNVNDENDVYFIVRK